MPILSNSDAGLRKPLGHEPDPVAPLAVDNWAVFLGVVKGRGGIASAVHGNGKLALTADRVWFRMFSPDRLLVIRRTDLRRVHAVTAHGGNRMCKLLLQLEYDSVDGTLV